MSNFKHKFTTITDFDFEIHQILNIIIKLIKSNLLIRILPLYYKKIQKFKFKPQ